MTDVTIFGAGIFGLSIAWACAQRGARVRVVDPNGPLAGASGGLVGALAPHVPENWNDKKRFQFESLIMAERFWSRVEAASGLPSGYRRSGRIQPLPGARQVKLAQTRARNAETLWRGRAAWRVCAANPAPGWAPDSPTGLWVRDTLSARVSPRRAGAALLGALETKRITVRPEARPEGARIWATGVAGLAELSAGLGCRIGGALKGQSALLRHAAEDLAQIYADGLHVVPHADGTVAIGSTSERDFDDPAGTDAGLEALIAKARNLVPALARAPVLERWAGLRPRARSRAPMLGPWPGRPGHFIANGGFKIGFAMAPKVAETIAELVLDGHDTIPDSFRVEASL